MKHILITIIAIVSLISCGGAEERKEVYLEKARQSCLTAGWAQDALAIGNSTTAINEGARRNKVILTEDANQLIDSDLDVILEVTGIPEAGTLHAWKALQSGKHVIMVTVEADALLGNARVPAVWQTHPEGSPKTALMTSSTFGGGSASMVFVSK